MDKKIIVVGAGLVGSLLSIMLRKKGFEVILIEKRKDMRLDSSNAGRSINLVVTSRGVNALKQVDLWGKVKNITTPVWGRTIHDREGQLSHQPYGRDETECNFSVSRGEINKMLMSEAEKIGVTIKFSSAIDHVDFKSKKIIFEDHSGETYDLLFGTDGGGSVIRRDLIKFVDGTCSTDRFMGDYKEMLMPSDSEGQYPLEKNALHIWPRGKEMLMALPNQDGSFTMTLYMPASRFSKISNPDELKNYFLKEYRDAVPLMPNYVEDYFNNPQGFLGTVRCSPWVYRDEVCLLGDAAHAIVPFFGQGMNSGFEDCYYLMKFLEEEGQWSQAFERYNEFQKPNTDAIANMALENAEEMSSKVGQAHFLLKKSIESRIEKAFPQKYRSRYGMVTYTLVPYALAFNAGQIQEKILERLAEDFKDNNALNLKLASSLIDENFTPFVENHNIDLSRYQI